MNDTELDRLLNTWSAPAPPESMRQDLRARFPRAERTRFARPLRWALVGLCSLGLTIAIAQTSESHGDIVMRHLTLVYRHLVFPLLAHRAGFLMQAIRESQPRVYVDGQPVAPLEYGHSSTLQVQVPGDGVYVAMFVNPDFVVENDDGRPSGWVEAGSVHGNVIEFQAGGKQVRIECNGSVVDGEVPVFVRRQPGQ
jgi:hypothetical protein